MVCSVHNTIYVAYITTKMTMLSLSFSVSQTVSYKIQSPSQIPESQHKIFVFFTKKKNPKKPLKVAGSFSYKVSQQGKNCKYKNHVRKKS